MVDETMEISNQDFDDPRPARPGGTRAALVERLDSAVMVVGPMAIGLAAACYAVIGKKLSLAGALTAGWGLWQLSMIAVVAWKVAATSDDTEDAERVRLGYKPRRRR